MFDVLVIIRLYNKIHLTLTGATAKWTPGNILLIQHIYFTESQTLPAGLHLVMEYAVKLKYWYFYEQYRNDLNISSAAVKLPFKIYITVLSSVHINTQHIPNFCFRYQLKNLTCFLLCRLHTAPLSQIYTVASCLLKNGFKYCCWFI